MWFIYSLAPVSQILHTWTTTWTTGGMISMISWFCSLPHVQVSAMPRRKEYKMVLEVPVWETLPGGHHEASPPCLCHFLRCSTGLRIFSRCGRSLFFSGDVHGNQRHHRLRRQHLLLPLHHRLWYLPQGINPTLPIFSGPLFYSSCNVFCPLCPDLFFARLSTGSRAQSNATPTPMESRRLRTSSLRWVT